MFLNALILEPDSQYTYDFRLQGYPNVFENNFVVSYIHPLA